MNGTRDKHTAKRHGAVRHFALVIAVLLSVACCFGIAQQPNLPALLETLKSDQWTERAAAAGHILGMPGALQSTQVRSALIELMDRENRIIDDSYRRRVGVSNEYGEGYGGYYATLLGTLTNIADFKDKRILEILAQGSYNPDSQFV